MNKNFRARSEKFCPSFCAILLLVEHRHLAREYRTGWTLPRPHARVAGSGGGMRKRLTAHGYRAPHVVVAHARGERCGMPRRGAAVGKSGLAQQSKGFCPIGLTPFSNIIWHGVLLSANNFLQRMLSTCVKHPSGRFQHNHPDRETSPEGRSIGCGRDKSAPTVIQMIQASVLQ